MSTLYSPWPTEAQRLLLRAALDDGPSAIDAFTRWQQSVDLDAEIGWSSVRLLPLAYTNLSRHRCTDPRMGLLKGVYRRVWSETNQLFHRAEPAVRALREAGIDVLLLKGAPLAIDYYRNLSHRPMSDLDLCVRAHQVDATVDVLRRCGWRPPASLARMIRYSHGVEFEHESGAWIDLHWRVLKEAPNEHSDEYFWSLTEPFDFKGISVRQLHPEPALLQTIVHGLRANNDPPIRWITDSLVILGERGDCVDWDRMIAFAAEHRVLHRLSLGLVHLADEYSAPIPAEHLRALRTVHPTWVERLENKVILRGGEASLAHDWVDNFARYCRYTRTGNPLKFVLGYPAFRYRAESGTDVGWALARAVRRRIHVFGRKAA